MHGQPPPALWVSLPLLMMQAMLYMIKEVLIYQLVELMNTMTANRTLLGGNATSWVDIQQ